MSATMMALVRRGNQARLEERPVPALLDGRDALVRVTLSTICTSDLHILHGAVPRARDGVVLGHEFVGEVVAVGERVNGLRPGQRVAANCITFCGDCWFCRQGYINNRFLLTAVLLVLPAAASVVSNAHPMVSYGVLLASVLGCMAGATLFNISAQTFIQQQTPDHLIGKVMSFVSVIAVCTLPNGQAMYGFLFEAFKERIFLVVLFAAVMGLVIALAVRHILRRVPSPQAMD